MNIHLLGAFRSNKATSIGSIVDSVAFVYLISPLLNSFRNTYFSYGLLSNLADTWKSIQYMLSNGQILVSREMLVRQDKTFLVKKCSKCNF